MACCRLAQLKAAGGGIPAQHRADTLGPRRIDAALVGVAFLLALHQQLQFQPCARRLKQQAQPRPAGKAAADAVDQAAQHRFQAPWIAQHVWQIGLHLQAEAQLAPRQLVPPERFEGLEDRSQIGACQLGVLRLPLQFRGMEDQTEAVDLFAALPIDLAQPLLHHLGQIVATQQGTDQRSDRGQGGAHLVGDGLEQAQVLRLVRGAAGGRGGLQGQAWRRNGELLGEARPELLLQLCIAV